MATMLSAVVALGHSPGDTRVREHKASAACLARYICAVKQPFFPNPHEMKPPLSAATTTGHCSQHKTIAQQQHRQMSVVGTLQTYLENASMGTKLMASSLRCVRLLIFVVFVSCPVLCR